jgi:hypothetical protein
MTGASSPAIPKASKIGGVMMTAMAMFVIQKGFLFRRPRKENSSYVNDMA